MRPAPALTQSYSLYLDLVRFLAALLVVFAHYIQNEIVNPGTAALLPDAGREAVIFFFVLSGFVIAYTTQSKAASAREYIVARCTRIYSVAIPTVLLGFALAAALAGLAEQANYQLNKPLPYLALHFLFLGQSWNLSEVPPLLSPYWSLCYEVWYYVLFGVAFYLRGWKRLLVAAVVLAVMGFKLWLLLPVWLSGVLLYHAQARYTMPRHLARIGLAVSLLALVAYNAAGLEGQLRALGKSIWPFAGLPLGSSDRFLADYLVCAIVFANLWCARFAGLEALQRFGKPIRQFASYTFTLYLAHMLVILVWQAVYPHDRSSALDVLGLSAAIALSTFALGQLTEQRKELFRAPFQWLSQLGASRT